mgnify:CR=1 FL=1
MIYGILTTAIILIFSGLIVKNNPDLIAGYNTLSEKEKEKILLLSKTTSNEFID